MEMTGLGINIKVKDIQISCKFYESLGFTPVFGYGPKEFLIHFLQGFQMLSRPVRRLVFIMLYMVT